jgi:retron-type reverse transcriptase
MRKSLRSGSKIPLKVKFNLKHLFKIAIILDVDIRDFFEGINIQDTLKKLS